MDNFSLEGLHLPSHVGVIMDGNGRWAKRRGLARIQGHNEGIRTLKDVVRRTSDLGIKYLTVYAFSTENWKRPEEEIGGIFKLLILYVEKELAELCENDVEVHILGDLSALPKEVILAAERAVSRTKGNGGLRFSIAINYGGRAEITKAVSDIAKRVSKGELTPEDIDEDTVSSNLYTADIPDPDLIIRTGGEKRLSNFLTWQSAYSELYFTETLWPDFTDEHYDAALRDFCGRDRRFGDIK